MTRFSTTFLVAVLSAFVLKVNAAPLQLHSTFAARAADVPDFSQESQCADSSIVGGLLSSALTLLDQINTNDNQVVNDLTTLKALLTAASEVEDNVVGSCNGTASANNGADDTNASINSTADGSNSTDSSNNATDTNTSSNNGASAGKSTGKKAKARASQKTQTSNSKVVKS
ncbi:hypothetical protein B0H19DRAFT_1232802 [Mycena capillaripes]|nr:hypothetical protein B0H19DRAFT_1232802 [Mycena capillaripes]